MFHAKLFFFVHYFNSLSNSQKEKGKENHLKREKKQAAINSQNNMDYIC